MPFALQGVFHCGDTSGTAGQARTHGKQKWETHSLFAGVTQACRLYIINVFILRICIKDSRIPAATKNTSRQNEQSTGLE